MKDTIDYEKNKRDNGGGCSICSSFPIVNVGEGSYWLCGDCVLEAISCLNCGQPKNTFCSKECEDIKMKELNYTEERDKLIPIAEKYADERNGISAKRESPEVQAKFNAAWNMDFHSKMNELAEGLE